MKPAENRISLSGAPLSNCKRIADVFRPCVLQYRDSTIREPRLRSIYDRQSPRVEQMHVVKLWRARSTVQAEELVALERIFKLSLEDILQDRLQFLSVLPSCHIHARKVGTDHVSYFDVTLLEVVNEMARYFKKYIRMFQWLPSTGNIYSTIARFVCTHECFRSRRNSESSTLNLEVGLGPPYTDWETKAGLLSSLSWQPDYISFEPFEPSAFEGREYHLYPRLETSVDTAFFGDNILNRQYKYCTYSDWLQWDDTISGFMGIIPDFHDTPNAALGSQEGVKFVANEKGQFDLPIKVMLTITDHLDSAVFLERTITTKVWVKIRLLSDSAIFDSRYASTVKKKPYVDDDTRLSMENISALMASESLSSPDNLISPFFHGKFNNKEPKDNMSNTDIHVSLMKKISYVDHTQKICDNTQAILIDIQESSFYQNIPLPLGIHSWDDVSTGDQSFCGMNYPLNGDPPTGLGLRQKGDTRKVEHRSPLGMNRCGSAAGVRRVCHSVFDEDNCKESLPDTDDNSDIRICKGTSSTDSLTKPVPAYPAPHRRLFSSTSSNLSYEPEKYDLFSDTSSCYKVANRLKNTRPGAWDWLNQKNPEETKISTNGGSDIRPWILHDQSKARFKRVLLRPAEGLGSDTEGSCLPPNDDDSVEHSMTMEENVSTLVDEDESEEEPEGRDEGVPLCKW